MTNFDFEKRRREVIASMTSRLNYYEDGTVTCKCCGGKKEIPYEQVVLYKPCEYCAGKGIVDWVTHATDRRSDEVVSYDESLKSCRNNVEGLIRKAKELCHLMGYDLRYDISKMDDNHLTIKPPLYARRP